LQYPRGAVVLGKLFGELFQQRHALSRIVLLHDLLQKLALGLFGVDLVDLMPLRHRGTGEGNKDEKRPHTSPPVIRGDIITARGGLLTWRRGDAEEDAEKKLPAVLRVFLRDSASPRPVFPSTL